MAEGRTLDAIRSMGRFVLNFRLIMLLLSVLTVAIGDGAPDGLPIALVLAMLASLVPLLFWDRVVPLLARHPSLFALDVMFTIVLLAFTGTDGPFLAYTEGTAFLAGLLYGVWGGALFGGIVVVGYLGVLFLRVAEASAELNYDALVQTPVTYLLFAIGGGAVRALLTREAATRAELLLTRDAAARNAERARLAREMHDTLGKTLHGIALAATALPRWVERDGKRAAQGARTVARAAETAAAQARDLIHDLRSDHLDAPLSVSVQREAEEWSERSDTELTATLEEVDGLPPESRYELLCVLREALRNVERHARATAVHVRLVEREGEVRLVVTDDGVGLEDGGDLERFAADGHYGLIGMKERAEHVGGSLAVHRSPGGGLAVEVVVPRTRAAADLVVDEVGQ